MSLVAAVTAGVSVFFVLLYLLQQSLHLGLLMSDVAYAASCPQLIEALDHLQVIGLADVQHL